MTIITQPLTDKKLAQLQEPLVKNEVPPAGRDAEDARRMVVMMHAHARRVSSTTTLCVFVTSLLVLSTGIIGGIYLYRQLTHYRLHHFKGWCTIPYVPEQQSQPLQVVSSGRRSSFNHHDVLSLMKSPPFLNFFEEEFDIDIEFENYEKIDVPDFSHGRHGRFIHDFHMNKTGIIDLDGHRCFVMPLNRSLVLPPQSLFDLIMKMRAGYYDVDTEIVRDTMRVVTPPITDLRSVGNYIMQECSSKQTYRLEPVNHSVFKRSLDAQNKTTFVFFSGQKINEINIVNMQEIEKP